MNHSIQNKVEREKCKKREIFGGDFDRDIPWKIKYY
jgi:hypothetical protein